MKVKRQRGRPKVDKPLVSRSFKIDQDELNAAIAIHGSKVVNQKVRDAIHRLTKKPKNSSIL